jgi:chromosomal replication initiation ATPase DnaA
MNALSQALRTVDETPVNPFPGIKDRIALGIAIKAGLTLADIKGPRRSKAYSQPRQHVMLALKGAGYSLSSIGRFLGGRDHTTIIHGIAQAEKRENAAETLRAAMAGRKG